MLKPGESTDGSVAEQATATGSKTSSGNIAGYRSLLSRIIAGNSIPRGIEIPTDDKWNALVSERLSEEQRLSSALDDNGTAAQQLVVANKIRLLMTLRKEKKDEKSKPSSHRKGPRRTAMLAQESNVWCAEFSPQILADLARNLGVSPDELERMDLGDLDGKIFTVNGPYKKNGFAARGYLFDTKRKGDPLIHSMHFLVNQTQSPGWLFDKIKHEDDDRRLSDYIWLGARIINAGYRSDSFECSFRQGTSYDIALEGMEPTVRPGQNPDRGPIVMSHHPEKLGAAAVGVDRNFPNPRDHGIPWSLNWIARMRKSPDVMDVLKHIPFDDDLHLLQQKMARFPSLSDLQENTIGINGFDRSNSSVHTLYSGFSGSSRKKH